ncbi:hypothetical protein N7519_000675 [Penicillium mononematosum]|uniref:uncharacterized protein n=1 Tax=Penicillium mononematosum TaxID=268346 RepID=UPI0025485DC4|nr:uncharacterized protein N7519_000675 [Penicillium mononematosum]KAJ6190654.1 hypothetical protein N7519_000675 [Penicillium mononematosum]
MSDNPSLMVRKFLEDNDSAVGINGFTSAFSSLEIVKATPVMRRARVTGFEIKLWGPYPALLGKPLHSVECVACEIVSQTQLDRLRLMRRTKPAKTMLD